MSLSFPLNGSFLDLINGYAPKVLAIQYLTGMLYLYAPDRVC